jgi:hypothetical protein
MVIDPSSAKEFTSGYSSLLSEVYRQTGGEPKEDILQVLFAARERVNKDSSLIDSAVAALKAKKKPVSSDVLLALDSLQLCRWVYLRDTTKYSVFIEVNGAKAYGVLGLNDRIKDIVGGSTGFVTTTGVVKFCGRYLCDGLMSSPVYLGSNFKKQYGAMLADIKDRGDFHVTYKP